MSQVLYRKYRPQTFADIIGQEVVKTVLQNALEHGRISHAYLFTGPRGVGKTSTARILAKALNCGQIKAGEPCDKCDSCQMIQAGRFLDLLEIDAASYTGVDNIREVIDQVRFAPSFGKKKVIIIDEVHMLSKAAFNALLKTLEEPPQHAVFILATTEIHKVPATIISRTQRFDFKPVSQKDIMELLNRVLQNQKTKLSPEARRLIASAAEGSFRDALSILDQMLSYGVAEISLAQVEEILGLTRVEAHQRFLDFFLKKQTGQAVEFVRNLALEGKDLSLFLRNFLEYLRLVLMVKMELENLAELGLLPEDEIKLSQQAENIPPAYLSTLIRAMLEAYRQMKTSPLPEMPLIIASIEVTAAQANSLDEKPDIGQKISENSAPSRFNKPVQKISNPKNPVPTNGLEIGDVLERWAEVLGKVKEYNHSLISSLRLGRIVEINPDNLLLLAFPYSFHKETIDARKNKIVIEQVLEDVFGQRIRFETRLERELSDGAKQEPEIHKPSGKNTETHADGDLITEAMKILGKEEDT